MTSPVRACPRGYGVGRQTENAAPVPSKSRAFIVLSASRELAETLEVWSN